MPVYRALDDPPSVPAHEASLGEDDLVVGIELFGEVVAYPVRYLSSYEVINDQVGGSSVVATWCPLAGSAVVYRREQDDSILTFDFAGGLLNNNLLMVDRETESIWSQLEGRAVDGSLKGNRLQIIPSIQSTWKFWRSLYPETRVFIDSSRGQPYLYDDWKPGDPPTIRPTQHDLSELGLGLQLGNSFVFLSFDQLEKSVLPVRLMRGSEVFRVHHDKEGLTAWAEDSEGNPYPAILVYSFAWFDFHPDSLQYVAP